MNLYFIFTVFLQMNVMEFVMISVMLVQNYVSDVAKNVNDMKLVSVNVL